MPNPSIWILRNAVTQCPLRGLAARCEAWSSIDCPPLLEQLYRVVIDGIESGEEEVARVLARIIINRMDHEKDMRRVRNTSRSRG